MTEKRFKYFEEDFANFTIPSIEYDGGKKLRSVYECCELLNKQDKTIQILFMDKQELENALARRERKIKEILQRHYDAKLGNDRMIETIAEDLSVELDLW